MGNLHKSVQITFAKIIDSLFQENSSDFPTAFFFCYCHESLSFSKKGGNSENNLNFQRISFFILLGLDIEIL